MYQVRIGLSQEIKLMTENTGDAIDLAIVCLENGYRVTIIPVDDDVKEVTQGGYDKWEKEEASELDMVGIGERIKARLDEIEMSQRELSETCKCTEVTMSRYISGDRTPKGPMIVLIAKALGVSCDWLLGNKEGK